MILRLLACLAMMLSLAAPAAAQQANGPITTSNSAQQDADIAIRMREILDVLETYDDVTVVVDEGIVTLRGTTATAAQAQDLDPLAARIEGVVAVRNQVMETTDLGQRLDPAIDRFRTRIDQLIAFLPLALIAAGVFAIIVLFGFTIARLKQPWERLAPNTFIAEIYRQLLRLAFVIIGIVVALDIVNATALLGTILGAAGIIGLALGFAVRDTVENFIASVMLSFRQPFRPNDTVEINGDTGKVIRLTSRATILLSFDGNHIRIPNAVVFKSRIINYSQNVERRFMFSLMIDRDADLQATRDLVGQTVQDLPFVLAEPAAQTWIEALHPAGIELTITGWVDQNETSVLRAKGETLRLVKLAIQSAGVVIPDATQAIQIHRDRDTIEAAPSESMTAQDVEASDDAALDRIVAAERDQKNNEDLLSEDALKE